ncbi:MAG: NAD-dependent deacylase [Bdellovibrionota bacterium]
MHKNIVILTGAGISAESGLSTFRDNQGFWDEYAIEEVATPEGFQKNPEMVHQFYNQRRAQLDSVTPNKAHHALAKLEKHWQGDFTLITQNVDDLHERAGSQNVIHMHGELKKARCLKTGKTLSWHEDLTPQTKSPFHPEAHLRPHIVWFGEVPFQLDLIFHKLDHADIFVSIGTSGQVHPAAGFVTHVYQKGQCQRIEINTEESEISHFFDQQWTGKATEKVPELLNLLHKI